MSDQIKEMLIDNNWVTGFVVLVLLVALGGGIYILINTTLPLHEPPQPFDDGPGVGETPTPTPAVEGDALAVAIPVRPPEVGTLTTQSFQLNEVRFDQTSARTLGRMSSGAASFGWLESAAGATPLRLAFEVTGVRTLPGEAAGGGDLTVAEGILWLRSGDNLPLVSTDTGQAQHLRYDPDGDNGAGNVTISFESVTSPTGVPENAVFEIVYDTTDPPSDLGVPPNSSGDAVRISKTLPGAQAPGCLVLDEGERMLRVSADCVAAANDGVWVLTTGL